MTKTHCKNILLLLGIVFGMAQPRLFGQTTKGTEFVFTFLPNLGSDSTFIYVSAERTDSVFITIPGQSWSQSILVTAGSLQKLYVPTSVTVSTTADTLSNKAIWVKSKKEEIGVYAASIASFTTDATCILPVSVIPVNTRYFTITANPLNSFNTPLVAVVAIEDNTEVEITPTAMLRNGRPAFRKFKITLNKGQVYLMSANDTLSGTQVVCINNKKVLVYCGDECSNIRCTACDHLFEQISPTNTWGKNFILTPFYGQSRGSDFIVVASQPNTIVTRNGFVVDTLKNPGDFYFEVFRYDSTLCIQTSEPTAMMQFMTGISCNSPRGGDPAMLNISPNEQTITSSLVATVRSPVINTHYINIVIPKAGLANCKLNDTVISSSSFTQIYCGEYYFHSRIIRAGNHKIECPAGFIAYIYGTGNAESYAYCAGASLKNLTRFIKYDFIPNCDTTKIVRFSSVGDSATRFKWFFSDGTLDTNKNPIKTYAKNGVENIRLHYFLFETKKWDSAQFTIRIEGDKATDFIPFSNKIVCDTAFNFVLPKTKLFSYKWENGDTNNVRMVKTTGKYVVTITNKKTNCKIKDSAQLQFYNKVNVNFGIITKSKCEGNAITLQDSSIANADTIKNYTWKIDFQTVSNNKSYNFISRANPYLFNLIVETNKGCKDSLVKNFLVTDKPTARFTWRPRDSCETKNLFQGSAFSVNLVGKVEEEKWLFSNGDTVFNIKRINKTFSRKDTGLNWVRLVAVSESGCRDTSDKKYFRIYPSPLAKFDLIDSAVCKTGNYFQFANLSKQDSANRNYMWIWGDESGQTFMNPTKKNYADTGTYNVAFIVIDKKSFCSDTSYRSVRVNPNIRLALSRDSAEFCFKQNYIAATAVVTPHSNNLVYNWNFGDGTRKTGANKEKYSYSKSGNYTVGLRVNAGKGCTDTARVVTVVYPNSVAKISLQDSFLCLKNNFFQFKNNSAQTQGSTRYKWEISNGLSFTTKEINKISFATAGKYFVNLSLFDPLYNCRDTAAYLVEVFQDPTIKLNFTDTVICKLSQAILQLEDIQSQATKFQYQWVVDETDTDTSTKNKAKIKLNQIGKHKIDVYAENAAACKDSATINVDILYPDSIGKLQHRIDKTCAPGAVSFILNCASVGFDFQWKYKTLNFGDKDSLRLINLNAGKHAVTLLIEDKNNCIFNFNDSIEIKSKMLIQLSSNSSEEQCMRNNDYIYKATTLNGAKPISYLWQINNVWQAETDSFLRRKYTDSGKYEITIFAADAHGCKDTSVSLISSVIFTAKPDFTTTNICAQEEFLGTVLNPINSVKYLWFVENRLENNGVELRKTYSIPGIKNVFVIGEFGSQKKCYDTSVMKKFEVFTLPIANFNFTASNTPSINKVVQFDNISQYQTKNNWILGKTNFSSQLSPTYNFTNTGNYWVKLIVETDKGCKDSIEKEIKIILDDFLFVPTSFTPNEDALNESFKPSQITTTKEYKMTVYNRWGQKLFETKDVNIGWDGKYLGKSVPAGVYVYQISGIYYTGRKFVQKGNVTLLN